MAGATALGGLTSIEALFAGGDVRGGAGGGVLIRGAGGATAFGATGCGATGFGATGCGATGFVVVDGGGAIERGTVVVPGPTIVEPPLFGAG
jgi:hypothetical protein